MPRAIVRTRLLVLVAATAIAQVPDGHPGSTECACIDPFNHSALDGNCPLRRATDGVCYAAPGYGGLGCRRYDLTSPTAECTARLDHVPPLWCDASWCWVDPRNCTRPKDTTHFFRGTPYADLTFSYETCGNVNEFSDVGRTEALQGVELRVSFPGNSGSGYTITTVQEGAMGVGGTRRDGSVVRFFAQLAQDYGATWREVPISAASRTFSPQSSFTACVHELALNATDLCIGNFWPTADRQRLVSFTVPIYTDEFRLVVPKVNTTKGLDVILVLGAPFEPFTSGTWLGLVLTALYFGVIMWLTEGGVNQEDFPERSPMSGMALGIYKALHALLSMDFRFAPASNSGKLAMLSFSFTTLLVVTFYAAQVTSNMVRRDQAEGTVQSLDEAIDRDYTFCLLQAISTSVLSRHPALRVVSVQNASEVFNKLDSGECKAGFVTADEWRKNINSQCHNKVLLDSSVYSMGNAYPVRDDLQAPMSWAITRALSAGAYAPIRAAAQDANLPPINRSCTAEGDTSNTQAASNRQLGLDVMAAPFLLSAVCCTIAMIIFWLSEMSRATRRQTAEEKLLASSSPSFAERTYKMKTAAKRQLEVAERASPTYDNQDLKLISKMLRSRNMTQIRMDRTTDMRTDGPLTLNDLPMLLSLMRDTIGLGREHSRYLRSSDHVDAALGLSDADNEAASPEKAAADGADGTGARPHHGEAGRWLA